MAEVKLGRRRLVIMTGCVFGSLILRASRSGATDARGPLLRPTGEDLVFLAYRMAGVEPPFAAWAAADRRIMAVDEFRRGAAEKALEGTMRARLEQIKDVHEIQMNLRTRFGEYNDRYSEFDFDMNDGTYVFYVTSLRRSGVIVRLTNGSLAQSWSLPPAEAAKVLHLTGDDRNVTLSMKLKPVAATVPASESDPLSIDARVVEYDIVSERNNLRLGHVVVK